MRVKQPLILAPAWIQAQQQSVLLVVIISSPFYELQSLIDSLLKQLAIKPAETRELQNFKLTEKSLESFS